MIIDKQFSERPRLSAFAGLVGVAVVICALYVFGTRSIANLTVFLFLAGLNAFQLRRGVRYALDFRTWFLMALLIAFFASNIFGNPRPEFGGGAPIPVTLYLNTPVRWLDSTVAQVLLVDETDQGFYVLTTPTGKAFFMPRSNVASIFFWDRRRFFKDQRF